MLRNFIGTSLRTSQRQSAAGSLCTPAVAGYATLAEMDASKLQIEKTASPKPKPELDGLLFGAVFSDHMLEVDWTKEGGWEAPKIRPFGDLHLHPSATSLHYGLECFEGMKAYIAEDGSARLFRPDKNMERMNVSSKRLGLPGYDAKEGEKLIAELVNLDKDWIPKRDGYSLYIRPAMISTQETLGVGPANKAKWFVILSPVGPYYPTGFAPVKLYADNVNQRAWPGGIGFTKAGGNYAPTIGPQLEANKKGYQQILWLAGENDNVTEVGTMNMMTLWINEDGEKELVTAPLDGTILPGVTRMSVLEMFREWGEFRVTERSHTIHELIKAVEEGRLLECFGVGTAAIVSPIELIAFNGVEYDIPLDPNNPDAGVGPICGRVAKEIMDIQYGRKDHPWSVRI